MTAATHHAPADPFGSIPEVRRAIRAGRRAEVWHPIDPQPPAEWRRLAADVGVLCDDRGRVPLWSWVGRNDARCWTDALSIGACPFGRVTQRWTVWMPHPTILELVDVRVARLHTIDWSSIRNHGIRCPAHDADDQQCVGECAALRAAFRRHWARVYGNTARRGARLETTWAANPWCWALHFRRVEVSRCLD